MVVEADQADAAGLDVGQGHLECREIVHLPPHVHPHVADHGRAEGGEGIEDAAPGVRAAQAGLPGEGDGVERGGDAVGEQLRLGVAQRQRGRKVDAGAGLQLAFERVAVQVDDPWQDDEAAGIDGGAGLVGRVESDDAAGVEVDRGFGLAAIGQQDPAAEKVHHNWFSSHAGGRRPD